MTLEFYKGRQEHPAYYEIVTSGGVELGRRYYYQAAPNEPLYCWLAAEDRKNGLIQLPDDNDMLVVYSPGTAYLDEITNEAKNDKPIRIRVIEAFPNRKFTVAKLSIRYL